MLRSLRVIAPAIAVMLVAACWDFDATTAGGDAPDASAPGDSSTKDATSRDAVAAGDDDAGDAGADAPVTTDAGSFCGNFAHPDASLFFCDDFDDHALPGKWNSFGETWGTLTITDAGATSKPNSLDELTMAADAGQVIDVSLRTILAVPALPATLRFAFELEPRVIDPTANAAIVLGAVDFLDGAGNRYSMGLAINVSSGMPALALGEQTGLADGGTAFTNHPLPPNQPIPLNAWSAIELEIDWTAIQTAQAIVYVNGTQKLNVPLTVTDVATSIQIGVGTSFVTEPGPAWELRYDDVTFTAQ